MNDKIRDTYIKWSIENITTSVETIFQHSESEIETLFLCSLMAFFALTDSLGLIVVGSSQNTIEGIESIREDFQNCLKAKRISSQRGIPLPLPKPEDERLVRTYEPFFGRGFFVFLQARFPSILVEGRSIRTDLAIFCPHIKQLNVVVECDGYQWHSSKQQFIADRKRDRALQNAGFEVLRFSGTEIHNTPHLAAYDLFKSLAERRGKRWEHQTH